MATILIQREDFDAGLEVARITEDRDDIGAVVTFTGLCRNDGGLDALELEHYPGMAEGQIKKIVAEAERRWPLEGVTVIHRYGPIPPGKNIVLVVTASTHRQAAFEAAAFLMDFMKTKAPFWKKEHHTDGSSSDWVEAKDVDDEATKRWTGKRTES